jgi:polyisoprenoid-binding protein YceI
MSVATQAQVNEPETKASTWEFDPAHSSAEFAIRHLMVSTVTGRFKALRGSIALDEASIEDSRVEAEIEAASIDTGTADRDNHLRSADFFDVVKHPKLTFRSSRVEGLGDSLRVQGKLSIIGVSRPVTLEVSYLGEIRDPWGNRRRGFSAETTLYRKDFGMTWNQVLDTGGVLVGDKVKVTLNIEAVEKRRP